MLRGSKISQEDNIKKKVAESVYGSAFIKVTRLQMD